LPRVEISAYKEDLAVFFREVLNEDLGCASYVVADGDEAVVIDPKWGVEEYLKAAEENGLRISLAALLLKRAGIEDVEHVADGGVPMLSNEGIELVEGT